MALPAIDRREHRRILQLCTVLPVALSIAVILSGLGSLAAWTAGYGMISGGAGPLVMLPITAVCFIIGGLALLVAQRRNRITTAISRLLAVGTAGIALFVLYQYAMGVEQALAVPGFPTPDMPDGTPRRMAINTTICFILFAQGLVFLEGDRNSRGLKSQFFATLVLIIAFIAIVGHAFDVRDFYSFRLLAGMSLSAAATLV